MKRHIGAPTTQSPAFREASPEKLAAGQPAPVTPPMRPLRQMSRPVFAAETQNSDPQLTLCLAWPMKDPHAFVHLARIDGVTGLADEAALLASGNLQIA